MIELKQICFTYADGADGGLKDIDLTVKSGECILLCGRSGCGKTTITRLINGLIPGFFSGELEGDVTINNESILGVPMYKISSHVGSVFQNPRTQFFNVDTDSEIAFGIENEAVPPEELNQRLENVTDVLHINSLRERNIFELSGGEKQKIALSEPILELRNVTLFYKKRMILEQISMKAAQGEVIAVVGHNGAGKTTFSRSLCGLHKDYTGDFYWKGIPINNKARLKLSYMVMQDVNYELFAESVRAECSFGIRNPPEKLLDDTIDLLGLMPYQNRHPNTLSGGQKQRVAVAVSMICGKELLIFDEPTSGLDYDSMEQVAGLIRSLASNGKIIFVVTHDYEFVCRSCSRILHFDNGTLEEDLLLSEQNEKKIHTIFGLKEEENYA